MKGILFVIEILKPPVLLFIAGLASPAVPLLFAILSPVALAPPGGMPAGFHAHHDAAITYLFYGEITK